MLKFNAGTVTALKPKGPALAVWAGYLGQKSNRVVVSAAEPGAVKLQLTAEPPKPSPGQAGQVTLAAADAKGPVDLAPELATFASSDEKIVAVDAKSGAFPPWPPARPRSRPAHRRPPAGRADDHRAG